uniref:NudC domain-containing protein 1 n=1 Tax=Steinernema glaseri TaxID=37863 RepID=A0A1I7ZIT3_9BILA
MASKECAIVDLAPNRLLLDPHFESYKLVHEGFPTVGGSLEIELKENRPDVSQFGLQHVRTVCAAEQLVFDPFNSSDELYSFYVIADSSRICGVQFDLRAQKWTLPKGVLELPANESVAVPFPASLAVLSEDHILACNGADKLILFHNGVVKSVLKVEDASVIADFRYDGAGDTIDVLLQSVFERHSSKDTEKKEGVFGAQLTWIQLANSGIEKRRRVIRVNGNLEMATLSASRSDVIVMTSVAPVVVHDSLKEVSQSSQDGDAMVVEPVEKASDEDEKFAYVWSQNDFEVSAVFNLCESVKKSDVNYELSTNSLQIKIGENIVISGRLGGIVNTDESTWTIDKNKLELTLFKSGILGWSDLIVGDKRGKFEPDPEVMATFAERLERITSARSDLSGDNANVNFNQNPLEDCDMMCSDEIMELYWVDGETHKIRIESDVSRHQVVFAAKLAPNEPRALCMRHDVDGILWKFDGQDVRSPATHHATFSAFGYVQAAKTQRKFTTCSPDYSYAAIIDRKRYAFLYWPEKAVNANLVRRNASGQRKVTGIAVQNVISLNKTNEMGENQAVDDPILGAYASNNALFLLTTKDVFAVVLKGLSSAKELDDLM